MLRLHRIIAIFVVIIIILINNGTIVRSVSPPPFCRYSSNTSTCPGDHHHVEIRYPFWIENRTSDDDGDCKSYPGFQVICAANGRPVINLSNNLYYVLDILNYYGEDGILSVVDVDIDAQECPQPRRNISIESLFLSDGGRNVNMTIFHNCSRYPQNVVQHMPCLDNNKNNTGITARRSFAFLEKEISGHHQFDWYENCEEAVVVPVDINYSYGSDLTDMNYTDALKSGIILSWFYPVNCGNCELSGGKCWANETNQAITTTPFHCYCTKGKTLVDDICPGSYYDSYPGFHKRQNSDLGSTKDWTVLIVGISTTVAIVLVSITFAFVVFYLTRKGARNNEEDLLGIENMPKTFSYVELRNATADFSPTHKLGEGRFGPVYKGVMSDGKEITVKRLVVSSHQGKRQFVAEISTISAVKHGLLVKLYGCCIEGANRLLVYEYLKNKSLDQALYGKSALHLDWPTRYDICLGVARGLAYLHEELDPRIVHRDVKASNILLDTHLNPKISDFGLAMLYDNDKTHISTRVAGTIGFVLPMYDVFGFGVVALELLCGRPNSDANLDSGRMCLLEWAWSLYENGRGMELVDPSLTSFNEEEVIRMLGIALLCTQASPMLRPSMSRVVAMLTGHIQVSTVTRATMEPPNYSNDWEFNIQLH